MNYGDKISFKGYSLITNLRRGDDNFTNSVGILIKEGIIFSKIESLDDICVIGIDTFNIIPVSLFSFYDNPHMKGLNKTNLLRMIDKAKHKPVIMGDFNAKDKLWDQNISSNDITNCRAKIILDFVDDSDMIIMNSRSTTRISPVASHNNSALDLTLADVDFVSLYKWSVLDESFGSDHLPTCLQSESTNINIHKLRIYDYKSVDWEIFNEQCGLKDLNMDDMSIDESDDMIEKRIIMGLEKSSHYFDYPNNKKRVLPWWDNEIDNMRKQKNKFLGIYIRTKSRESLTNMKKFNCIYKRMLKKKKNES